MMRLPALQHLPSPAAKRFTLAVLAVLLLHLAGPGTAAAQVTGGLGAVFPSTPAPALELFAAATPQQSAPGGVVVLELQGHIAPPYYLYSVHPAPNGPEKGTEVLLEPQWLQKSGATEESAPRSRYDAVFGGVQQVHEGLFQVRQRLRLAADAPAGDHTLHGALHYQVCDGRICSPGQSKPFTFLLTVAPAVRPR